MPSLKLRVERTVDGNFLPLNRSFRPFDLSSRIL
jgi:hypothetical protein